MGILWVTDFLSGDKFALRSSSDFRVYTKEEDQHSWLFTECLPPPDAANFLITCAHEYRHTKLEDNSLFRNYLFSLNEALIGCFEEPDCGGVTREGDQYSVRLSGVLVASEMGESSWLIGECSPSNAMLEAAKPKEQTCIPSYIMKRRVRGELDNKMYSACERYCLQLPGCVTTNIASNGDCHMFDSQNKAIGCIQAEPPTLSMDAQTLLKERLEHMIKLRRHSSSCASKGPADTLAKCVYEQLYQPIRCEGGAAGRFLSPPSRVDALCYQAEVVLWAHCGNVRLPCILDYYPPKATTGDDEEYVGRSSPSVSPPPPSTGPMSRYKIPVDPQAQHPVTSVWQLILG